MNLNPNPSAFALLMDIRLPVQIAFGRTRMPLGELLKLEPGSIVELDTDINSPVEILVHDRVIATGEVVDVDGYYGIRILSRRAAGASEPFGTKAGREEFMTFEPQARVASSAEM